MKNIFAIAVFILMISASCSKKSPDDATYPDGNFVEEKYDTMPLDSFSKGATSVDIARKIRMSSFAYQDSVKKAILKQQEEKKLQEEKAKLEKEAEKSLEEAKPKIETPSKPDNNSPNKEEGL